MANQQIPMSLLQGMNAQQVPIVTQEQKAEVELVRAMQVRTAAADQATKLLAGKAPNQRRWLDTAMVIERYILGLPQLEVPAPTAGRPSVP